MDQNRMAMSFPHEKRSVWKQTPRRSVKKDDDDEMMVLDETEVRPNEALNAIKRIKQK